LANRKSFGLLIAPSIRKGRWVGRICSNGTNQNFMTKLSINLVHHGCYVKAGDPLPPDFVMPPHLEAFVIDEPSQASRADHRFSFVEGQGAAEDRLAKPAMTYEEAEEEFVPRWEKPKKHAKEERKGR
jgi:hypothetical protein